MAGVNKVIIVGNLGGDPEIRSFDDGERVANFSMATSETWKDKETGEKKEKTEWHRIVVFGKLVDVIEKYVKRGDKLFVEGQLRTRKWDKDGTAMYTTEVVLKSFNSNMVMLGSKSSQGEAAPVSQTEEVTSQEKEDEIPF